MLVELDFFFDCLGAGSWTSGSEGLLLLMGLVEEDEEDSGSSILRQHRGTRGEREVRGP